MSGIWKTMLDYVYGELVRGLTDFFTMMNNMGADTLDLPWVQAIVLFFSYLGWSLFLAGTAVAIFDCAIEAQNGKPAVRDMSLNLLKGFLAVSLFTVVPVELFKFSVDLQGELGKAICEVFQIGTTDISTLSMEQLQLFTETTMLNLFFVIGMGYCVIKVFFANIKRGGILLINIAVGSMYMLSVPRGFSGTTVSQIP